MAKVFSTLHPIELSTHFLLTSISCIQLLIYILLGQNRLLKKKEEMKSDEIKTIVDCFIDLRKKNYLIWLCEWRKPPHWYGLGLFFHAYPKLCWSSVGISTHKIDILFIQSQIDINLCNSIQFPICMQWMPLIIPA